MYVNPILSDFIRRQNQEFEEGLSLSITLDQKELEEQDLLEFLNASRVFNGKISYFTNFRKFCDNERKYIQQWFLTDKIVSFIDIENKNYSLFEQYSQFINHGNINLVVNICSDISWRRLSIFKKHIIIYPESYMEYFLKTIKSIFNWTFYSNNIYYFNQ